MVPSEDRSGPGTTSWSLHPSLETFSCQLARHFAAPCPAFRHFIQSCMPNLHLPPLTGLLQPLDMLKCPTHWLPCFCLSGQTCKLIRQLRSRLVCRSRALERFLRDWAWPVRFWLQWSLWRLLRCHLRHCYQVNIDPGVVHQPFKGLFKRWSAPCGRLWATLCVPMPKLRKFLCLLASLESRWWHWSCWGHQKPKWTSACPTTSGTRSMTANSRGQTPGGAFAARNTTWAPCWCQCPANLKSPSASRPLVSSVIIVFDLFFASVCTSLSLEWHLLGCRYVMLPTFQHIVSCIYERSEQVCCSGCAVILAAFSSEHQVCFASLWRELSDRLWSVCTCRLSFHLSYKEGARLEVQPPKNCCCAQRRLSFKHCICQLGEFIIRNWILRAPKSESKCRERTDVLTLQLLE